jgi:DNA-binding MarR family transcriptional regulator
MTSKLSARRPESKKKEQPNQILNLGRYVPGLITHIANKLSRNANSVYQRRFGVSVTEWRILSQLAIEPGIPASRICFVIGFDKGPISRTLTAMETRGLITIRPNPRDARSYAIDLTNEGRRIHNEIIVVALERERSLLACLQPQEVEMLINLLVRVHSNIGAVADT